MTGLIGAALLQGCGGGLVDDAGHDLGAGALIALAGADAGANGQPFAVDGQSAADLEGQSVSVRMARVRRPDTATPWEVIVTDETVLLPADWFRVPGGGATLTLDGEEVIITASPDTTADLIVENDLAFRALENGARVELRIANDDNTALENAFYVIGLETDPAALAGLTSAARYDGTLNVIGYAQVVDGPFSNRPSRMAGDLTIDVDFDNQTVSGGLVNGTVDLVIEDAAFIGTFDASFADAPIVQNGFATDLTISNCIEVPACDGGNSQIGGLFYGSAADAVAGLVTVDQTFEDEGFGTPIRMIGAGAFDGASASDVATD